MACWPSCSLGTACEEGKSLIFENSAFAALIPLALFIVSTVIVHRLTRQRRAKERAQGTFRMPAPLLGVGWMAVVGGAYFLVESIIILVLHGPDPPNESHPVGGVIGGSLILFIGAGWLWGWGRRRITVWGEHVRYRPHLGFERTIWALDAVKVESGSAAGGTLWIRDREGRKASWFRGAFPHRTVAAIRHGVHHNTVEMGGKAHRRLDGVESFVVGKTLEMPDGTTAAWHPSRTVQLKILISTPSTELLDRADGHLNSAVQALDRPVHGDSLPSHDSTGTKHAGVVEGTLIECHRRSDQPAIDACIRAGGENGLDSARRAYAWLRSQLTEAAVEHLGVERTSLRHRARAAEAFTVTYRETWS